jgi:hypothetical protein
MACLTFATMGTPGAARADMGQALLSLLTTMETNYAGVRDYTTTFSKKEIVENRPQDEETILFKFQKPFKVFMRWVAGPSKGAEALYVEGQHDNKVIVRRDGLLGFLSFKFDPLDQKLMHENLHPITDMGFGMLIKLLRKNIQTAMSHSEIEIVRIGEEPFKGRAATVVEAKFKPAEGREYCASRLVCHIDKELMLPAGASFYDEKNVLFGQYSFTNTKLNVGLTEKDFSK